MAEEAQVAQKRSAGAEDCLVETLCWVSEHAAGLEQDCLQGHTVIILTSTSVAQRV